ncbi:hypothetical protein AMS68_006096 [Peltaster fructicola]|uniref:Cytochrome c oxidase assembly protein COX20, mitochondrial n=1 Tax=Peltaster fructicola TaxID=286661 RepID=A0A6H0Y139_9PEZI|nr:hypothetical protein AMS68_006096 [Peltaster fructicola]
MADDTRKPTTTIPEDLSKEALNVRPLNVPFSGKQWQDAKAAQAKPFENANMMAGGTQHTAGGQLPEVTLQGAIGTIKAEEFWDIAKKPCVRDAFMTGIGVGFGAGGLRAILGARVWLACNWAVGSFIAGSMVQYQYCQYRRHAEKEGMLRAVEVINRKEIERKAREARRDQVKSERRKAKDEEQDSQLTALKEAETKKEGRSSWKWW